MPETPDTSSEAVERAAADLDYGLPGTPEETAAATLRALASERDAFKAERDEAKRENAAFWQTYSGLSKHAIFKDLIDGYRSESRLHAERDTAIARVEAAESDRDALLKVARAAHAVIEAERFDGGLGPEVIVLSNPYRDAVITALDALSPELRAMLEGER